MGSKGKADQHTRRFVGGMLATILLVMSNLPGIIVVAAPQMFYRLGAGVSNQPLDVLAFSPQQFGDIGEAVNIATGNVYLDLGALNRNNELKATDDTDGSFGNFKTTGVMRLAGFNSTLVSAPAEWGLGVGDGSLLLFRKASTAEINNAPTWISERYSNIRNSATLYITKPQNGTQTHEEWIITYKRSDNRMVSHYYDHFGNRTTFLNDGQYADYTQTPHQQYQTVNEFGDPDGTAGSYKTEYIYSSSNSGRITKIKDAWGRVSTYDWDHNTETVTAVNMLLGSESDPNSWSRRIEYTYQIIGGQRVVNNVTFKTDDGRGNKVGRRFTLAYKVGTNGAVLLEKITRPVLGKDPENYGIATVYSYDSQNRVIGIATNNEEPIQLSYSALNIPGAESGSQVVQTQGDKREIYQYNTSGQLRYYRVRHYDPISRSDGEAVTSYWYDQNDRVLATTLPSGAQIQNTYDIHGNLLSKAVYQIGVNWSQPSPAGYEYITKYTYDRDNRVTSELEPSKSGNARAGDVLATDASYQYDESYKQYNYSDYVQIQSQGINFKSVSEIQTTAYVNNAIKRTFASKIDLLGRVESDKLYQGMRDDKNLIKNVEFGYYLPNYTALNTYPDQYNTYENNIKYQVRQYSDLPAYKKVNGNQHLYFYDVYGNNVYEEISNSHIYNWDNGNENYAKVSNWKRYNGFGQLVWENIYEGRPATGTGQVLSRRQLNYYPTGELDAEWNGETSNTTDYIYYDVQFAAPKYGRLTAIVKGIGSQSASKVNIPHDVVNYDYDGFGRITNESRNGYSISHSYTTLDKEAKTVDYTLNKESPITTSRSFDTIGNILTETIQEPNVQTRTTQFFHDTMGNIFLTEIFSDGKKIANVKNYYDPHGRIIKSTDNSLTMLATELDRSSFFKYDTSGNLTGVLGPIMSSGAGQYQQDYRRPLKLFTYDNLGRTISIKTQLTGSAANSNTLQPAADAIFAEVKINEYDFQGNATKIVDENNYITEYKYDYSGNRVATRQQVWNGSEYHSELSKTTFYWINIREGYDGLKRPLMKQDARGYVKRTEYNFFGPYRVQDERGQVIRQYSYTADGLPLSTFEPSPNNGNALVTTQYNIYSDCPYPMTIYRAHMDVQAGPSTGAATGYIYDGRGNIIQESLPQDQQGQIHYVKTRYNSFNKPNYIMDADGFTTTNNYNWQGNLILKKQAARPGNQIDFDAGLSAGLTAEYTYDAAGNMTRIVDKGLITTKMYNSLGNVISETRPHVSESTAAAIKYATYRLDGIATAITGYGYGGNINSIPDYAGHGDKRITQSGGNLTTYVLRENGDAYLEVSWGVVGNAQILEYAKFIHTNGLGLKYLQRFYGNEGIYARQKNAYGEDNWGANYFSYYRYDENQNLISSWDTPTFSDQAYIPIEGTRNNYFEYQYSPTNKEISSRRVIEIRVKGAQNPNITALTIHSGAKGILVAGSSANTITTYNARDQISSYKLNEMSPQPDSSQCGTSCYWKTAPDLHYKFGKGVTLITNYDYYLDGRNRTYAADGKVKSIESYDLRGRETVVRDGGITINTTYSPGVVRTQYSSGPKVETTESFTIGNRTANLQSIERKGSSTDETGSVGSYSDYGNVPRSDAYRYDGITGNLLSTNGLMRDVTGNGRDVSFTTSKDYDAYGELVRDFSKVSYERCNDNGCGPAIGTQENLYSYTFSGANSGKTVNNDGVDSPLITFTENYSLDSHGNRLSVEGGNNAGFTKRYDADMRVVEYHLKGDSSRCNTWIFKTTCYSGYSTRYNHFRYDPFGNEVVSGVTEITEGATENNLGEYRLIRQPRSTFFLDGEVQYVLARGIDPNAPAIYSSGTKSIIDTYSNAPYLIWDTTFSAYDGTVNEYSWMGLKPFSFSGTSVEQLDAPVETLSSVLKINPLDIDSTGIPNLPDPSQIQQDNLISQQDVPIEKETEIAGDSNKQPLQLPVGETLITKGQQDIQELGIVVNPQSQGSGTTNVDQQVRQRQRGIGGQTGTIKPRDLDPELSKQNDKLEKQIKNRFDNYSQFNTRYGDATEKVSNSVNNLLYFAQETMTPVERAAFLEGLVIALDNAYKVGERPKPDNPSTPGNEARDISIYNDTGLVNAIVNLERARKELAHGTRQQKELVKDSMLAWATYEYAKAEYTGVKASAVAAVLTSFIGPEVAIEGVLTKAVGSGMVGRVGARLARGVGSTSVGKAFLKCMVNSFTPDTLVHAATGLMPISQLHIGDKVLAYNETTESNGYYPITAVHRHDDPSITTLKLQTSDGLSETITTTPEHPFYVTVKASNGLRPRPVGHEELNERWVSAGDLVTGDKLKLADGREGSVVNVITRQQTQEMFNLTVAQAHTFFVGTQGWLVHNCANFDPSSLKVLNLNQAARAALTSGNVRVSTRAEAEALFQQLFGGRGYTNTTGLNGRQSREALGSKQMTYHWDYGDTQHGGMPHIQVHTPDRIVKIWFEEGGGIPVGSIERIFWETANPGLTTPAQKYGPRR